MCTGEKLKKACDAGNVKRRAGHGEFLRARQNQPNSSFSRPSRTTPHLQMKTTKISLRTNRMSATENRAGNQAVSPSFISPSSSSLISAPSRVRTRRGFAACSPPMATTPAHSSPVVNTDGNDVLIVEMPDLLSGLPAQESGYGCQPAQQDGACKFVKRDLTLQMTTKLASAGLADMDFTDVRRVNTVSPASKAFAVPESRAEDTAERVGVSRDSVSPPGTVSERGRFTEGTRAKRRPQA